jgi:hypothetical protein
MNGVEFCCERIDTNKKAKDSIIMIKNTSPNSSSICGGIYVGRIQSFIQHVPPGSKASDAPSLIIDAKWFAIPDNGDKQFNHEIGCPNVMRTYRNDPGGNLWPFQAVAPTKIILGPHLQYKNMWQVLHQDSDFLIKYF